MACLHDCLHNKDMDFKQLSMCILQYVDITSMHHKCIYLIMMIASEMFIIYHIGYFKMMKCACTEQTFACNTTPKGSLLSIQKATWRHASRNPAILL